MLRRTEVRKFPDASDLPQCCWRLTPRRRSHWGCCWSCYWGSLGQSQGRCYMQSLSHINQTRTQKNTKTPLKIQQSEQGGAADHKPAISRERFLAVVMGLSRRRSSGLLLRSLTFCFSLERSFRLGSEAEQKSE